MTGSLSTLVGSETGKESRIVFLFLQIIIIVIHLLFAKFESHTLGLITLSFNQFITVQRGWQIWSKVRIYEHYPANIINNK